MLIRLAEFIAFGIAPLLLGALFMPGIPVAEEVTISGEVLYRERMALPPNAVLTLELADVSRAGVPAAVIAKQTIEPAGQVPIKFEIEVDPAVLQPNMSYALQARIAVDDALWFINDQRHAVDPLKPVPQTLLLKRVSQ